MRVKYLIGAALVVSFAGPALADSFYVVQDASTKRCSVVSQKPTTTTTTVVGDGTIYTTQSQAESAMKTITVCQSR